MQRKIFRIEQTMSKRQSPLAPHREAFRAEPISMQAPERELAAACESIDKSRRELAALAGQAGDPSQLARAREQLGAAISGMEKATQQILKVTEVIDESARALLANLKDPYNRGLAQDIQENSARVYEACNFQDILGQHISQAMTTLKFAEERVARVLEVWGGADHVHRLVAKPRTNNKLINGPKLEGDGGHTSQHDIDRLFG